MSSTRNKYYNSQIFIFTVLKYQNPKTSGDLQAEYLNEVERMAYVTVKH